MLFHFSEMTLNVKSCQSCGMPMREKAQHAGGDPESPYCCYCATPHGVLKSREEVRRRLIKFHMESLGMTREEAEKKTDEHMASAPAWRNEE